MIRQAFLFFSLLLHKLTRTHAILLLEPLAEVGDTAEACHVGHLGHGVFPGLQEGSGMPHLGIAHQLVDGDVHQRLHLAVEGGVAHAHLVGNKRDVHAFQAHVLLDDPVHLFQEVAVELAEFP